MSKKDKLENLAVFIGLRAAHEILIKLTNKPESVSHLKQEADTYGDLIFSLVDGNWNIDDLEKIKKLAKKRCGKKLMEYEDIEEFNEIENVIGEIMNDLELI